MRKPGCWWWWWWRRERISLARKSAAYLLVGFRLEPANEEDGTRRGCADAPGLLTSILGGGDGGVGGGGMKKKEKRAALLPVNRDGAQAALSLALNAFGNAMVAGAAA